MNGVFTSEGIISQCAIGQVKPNWCLWEHNTDKLLKTFDSFGECLNYVYSDVVLYSRPPTEGELRFGEGATHYRYFAPIDCVKPSGELKKWFIAEDGLRYYR